MNLPDRAYWLERVENILHHPNLMQGDVIISEKDRKRIWNIQQIVIEEFEAQKPYHRQIISNCISNILSLIIRNISEHYSNGNQNIGNNSKIAKILTYIRSNVYDNEAIKLDSVAKAFNVSTSNISSMFKKQTGESIRQFITAYRLSLVKQRLSRSDYSISEIAYQLGFTDESHLSRTFKKHFGITPGQYKKSAKAAEEAQT